MENDSVMSVYLYDSCLKNGRLKHPLPGEDDTEE